MRHRLEKFLRRSPVGSGSGIVTCLGGDGVGDEVINLRRGRLLAGDNPGCDGGQLGDHLGFVFLAIRDSQECG